MHHMERVGTDELAEDDKKHTKKNNIKQVIQNI